MRACRYEKLQGFEGVTHCEGARMRPRVRGCESGRVREYECSSVRVYEHTRACEGAKI